MYKCTNYGNENSVCFSIDFDRNAIRCTVCGFNSSVLKFRDYFNTSNQVIQNPFQMKSDPCESPTREVRKELTVNVARSVQISEWNSCADRVINTIDNYTAALTNEDKKQIKSRLDNILKLLLSK